MSRKSVERNIAYDDVRKKYYITLEYGKDPLTGKQIKKTKTFSKLKQARAALRKHEADYDAGKTVLPSETTLAQWMNDWMENVISLNRAETTVYAYRTIIEKHIVPFMGQLPLQAITPQHLQRYYAMLIREKGLSANTARKHHDLLSMALKQAVRQGLLLRNPAELVDPPKPKAPEIHYYTMEELQTLFRLAEGTRIEILVKLAGYLGLRREEILGLTWDCVSFEARKIEIKSVRTAAGSHVIIKEPKTKTSRRTLYMPDDLIPAFHREQEKQAYFRNQLGAAYQESGYVFTHEDGRPVRPNYASDLFVRFIKENNLPPLTLHGLRHSFASIANAKGISMFDIGRALGHSSPSTTSRIYTHLLDPDHRDLLNTLWSPKETH